MKTVHRNSRGFSLLEVLIAVAVLSFGLLALASLQASLVRTSSESKARSVGLALAKDKVEELRNFTTLTGYRALVSGTDSGGTQGGVTYTRRWAVTRYVFEDDVDNDGVKNEANDQRFELNGTVTGATPAGFVADNEFKRVVMAANWTDGNGAAQSITIEDAIGAISPSDSTKIAKITGTQRPRSVEVQIANPALTPGVIPIAVGDGTDTAATNPRPEVVGATTSGTVIETRFDVLTYAALTDTSPTATAQQRVETAVIGCTCDAASGNVDAFRPTYWNGERYLPPATVALTTVSTPRSGVTQSTRCEACCRDHRDPTGITGPKFDPRRTDGHKHFNVSLVDADAVTAGTYREACRLIRVDGFFRVATDLYDDYFGVLATASDSTGTAPSAAVGTNYEGFVLAYLNDRFVDAATADFNTPLTSTRVAELETTHSLNPPVTDISAATDPKWTHGRGLYIDFLDTEAKDLIESAKSTCGSTNACVLKYLPFTSINLTEVATWTSSATTAIQVSNNGFPLSATDPDPVKGKVLLGTAPTNDATANAQTAITASNSGVAIFSPVDANTDSTVLSDSHPFRVVTGVVTPPGGGSFGVTMGGAILPISTYSAAPPNIDFSISGIPHPNGCNANGTSVLPFDCSTISGQTLGGLATFVVHDYNRQDTKTVLSPCPPGNTNVNKTATMAYRTLLDVDTVTSSNGAATVNVNPPTNPNGIGLVTSGGEGTSFTVDPLAASDSVTITFINKVYQCPDSFTCSGGGNKDTTYSNTFVTCPTGFTP